MSDTKTTVRKPETVMEGNVSEPSENGMDDADSFIVERIAEAVVRKIDERDKISLLAEAVIARLQELGQSPIPEKDQAKEKEEKS
jgi:L-lysine 2,3-aminomutase